MERLVLLADPERYDCGEKEMWEGRANYVLGDLDGAREYMKIANEKSGGRCFRPKDTVYKDFYFNSQTNTKMNRWAYKKLM